MNILPFFPVLHTRSRTYLLTSSHFQLSPLPLPSPPHLPPLTPPQVGHGLGGALAEIDAVYLRLNVPFIRMNTITFGKPRVGNEAWAYLVDANVRFSLGFFGFGQNGASVGCAPVVVEIFG